MAFEGLSEKLSAAFKKLRGKGRLSEADVKEAMREIRLALLEADVSYKVVKQFIAQVTEKAVGADVLEALSPARIEALARRWAQGAGRQEYAIGDLKEELAALPWQRLRWRVLRQFGALPTEERAREMTDGDYLWCAVNLLLDEEEEAARLCPVCREEAQRERCPVCGRETGQVSRGENPAFDWARFERMKRGERP